MKILQINKFGTAGSGADKYFLEVGQHLADARHEVAYVCSDPDAFRSADTIFEVPPVDFHESKSVMQQANAAARVLWSRTAAEVVSRAIQAFGPDIVHLHNYAHQLSSSVVHAAKRLCVPTVATAHDYKLVCPSYTALRNGAPCFRCARGAPVHVIGGRCLNGRISWSATAAVEASMTRLAAAKLAPDVIVAPSEYMLNRLRGSWLARAPVSTVLLRNPCPPPAAPTSASAGGGIYVGRLSAEKGLSYVIEASARSGVRVDIVGDGPCRRDLEAAASRLNAPVSFHGFLSGEHLQSRWAEAGFFVLYPTWPENAPLALLEAMVAGKPGVVADVGGLAELPRQYGGYLVVPPKDVEELSAAFQRLSAGHVASPDAGRMQQELNWDAHLSTLEVIYEESKRAH